MRLLVISKEYGRHREPPSRRCVTLDRVAAEEYAKEVRPVPNFAQTFSVAPP
jgi:hypothetical protein